MYAVIRSGGRQHQVHEGDTIRLGRLQGEVGSEVVFDDVILIRDANNTIIGKPRVGTARVVGEIVAHGRGPKIDVYTFKRRKGYSRKLGHRQPYTEVLIKSITTAA